MPSSSPIPSGASPRNQGSPRATQSPRLSATEVAKTRADLIREQLNQLLADATRLLEFDVAIGTGKSLMTLRKQLMSFMGWTDMPTTTTQQVPDVVLSKLQERFLPNAKHLMYVKLVQAFHSAVNDVNQILDEMLFLNPGDSAELAKWKEREPRLMELFDNCLMLLAEHGTVIIVSLAKEDEFVQVMELGGMLQPEIDEIIASLDAAQSSLSSGIDFEPDTALRLTRAKVVLETGEDNVDLDKADDPSELVPKLAAKFGSISDVLRSVNATSKGLMLLSGRVRLVNQILSGSA